MKPSVSSNDVRTRHCKGSMTPAIDGTGTRGVGFELWSRIVEESSDTRMGGPGLLENSSQGTRTLWRGQSVRSDREDPKQPIDYEEFIDHESSTVRGERVARVRKSLLRDHRFTLWRRGHDSSGDVTASALDEEQSLGRDRREQQTNNITARQDQMVEDSGVSTPGGSRGSQMLWRETNSLFSFTTR